MAWGHMKFGGEETLGAYAWSWGDVQGVAPRGSSQLELSSKFSQRAGSLAWRCPSSMRPSVRLACGGHEDGPLG